MTSPGTTDPPAVLDLIAFLPNLVVPIPTPLECGPVAICSGKDPRLAKLAETPPNSTGSELLKRFQTTFGRAYLPSCLVVSCSASRIYRTADALRDFRNICAVASVGYGCASSVKATGSLWAPRFSDFFLLGHHVPATNGWITTLEGPVTGATDETGKYHGHPLPQIDNPANFSLEVDKPLLSRLFPAWVRRCSGAPPRRLLRRLFRSLEVAFQASRYPSDGLTTPHDVGTRLGLWVSAFEVLLHPDVGEVNKSMVFEALRRVSWTQPELSHRRFWVRFGKKTRRRVALPEKIYDEIYAARNKFLHGERVSSNDQHFGRSTKRLPLMILAPILYGAVLRPYLAVLPGQPRSQSLEPDEYFFGLGDLSEALLEAKLKAFRSRTSLKTAPTPSAPTSGGATQASPGGPLTSR